MCVCTAKRTFCARSESHARARLNKTATHNIRGYVHSFRSRTDPRTTRTLTLEQQQRQRQQRRQRADILRCSAQVISRVAGELNGDDDGGGAAKLL